MSESSNATGASFEDEVEQALTYRQWVILGRHVVVDSHEVDIVAYAPGDEAPWFIECKGGTAGRWAGLRRTDTVKRTVGTAWGLRRSPSIAHAVYFVVTTALPTSGTMSHGLLASAVSEGLLDGVGVVEDLLALHAIRIGTLPAGGLFSTSRLTR